MQLLLNSETKVEVDATDKVGTPSLTRNCGLDSPLLQDGMTPLLLAIKEGNTEIATLLIRGGAKVDAKDKVS